MKHPLVSVLPLGLLCSLYFPACGDSSSTGSTNGISCLADGICQLQCAADPDCARSVVADGAAAADGASLAIDTGANSGGGTVVSQMDAGGPVATGGAGGGVDATTVLDVTVSSLDSSPGGSADGPKMGTGGMLGQGGSVGGTSGGVWVDARGEDAPTIGTGGMVGQGGNIVGTGGLLGQGGSASGTGTGGIVGQGGNIVGTGGLLGQGGSASGTGGVFGEGGTIVGSGGALATGGATGVDAAQPCTPNKASGNYPIIDNMADGDSAILSQDGRSGGWYTFNDGTGTQIPAAPAVVASKGSICTSGFDFTGWGAGLGTSLDADGTNVCTYDASVYQGITFTLEGVVAGGIASRFTIPTADVSRASDLSGGSCVDSTSLGSCNDFFGVSLTGSSSGVVCRTPTNSWICGPTTGGTGPIAITIPFSKMAQAGWVGSRVFPSFDTTRMISLQWNFFGSSTTTTTFSVCVGKVSFY